MTPRKRSNRKAGWPANLYESKGYYSYRNPQTHEWFGLGRDRGYAIDQALEANLHLAGTLRKERLIDRISGTAGRTVADWGAKYLEICAEQKLALNTMKAYGTRTRHMIALLGADTKLKAVTALQVSEGLESLVKSGRASTAKALRGFMRESFAAANVKGWREDNPVRDIRGPSVEVQRARLTWEVFEQIYAAVQLPWLRNAMALAIISAQRRADIAAAQFRDVKEGLWWVDQGKTGSRLCLPEELRLDCFGISLGEVLKQCRSTGVLSHYLIHQTERAGRNRPGRPLRPDLLSIKFTDALRPLKLDFAGKDPPTFHEIRSLSARLYKKQGNVNTQELLGHKSANTTLLYEDGRGEWIRVKVGTV